MQNVADDISLRLTAAGSTRTDTVVLLHLDTCWNAVIFEQVQASDIISLP